MPQLVRWTIKTALIYFVIALSMAALVAAQPLLGLSPTLQALRPVYLHFLMVGWVTQLIIGMAYWMFPKFSKERPRRSDTAAWGVYVALNSGLILRGFGEPLTALQPDAGWMLALSAVCQLVAAWAFIFNTWSRVKER